MVKAKQLYERFSTSNSLQVAFLKLWSLASKADQIIAKYDQELQGKTVSAAAAKVSSNKDQ